MAKALPRVEFEEYYRALETEDSDSELEFYSSIDKATRTWLNSLHQIWNLWKKSNAVSRTLCDYFVTAPNPYLSTLRILVNTNQFYQIKIKSSLAVTVIEEFKNWITPHKDDYKHFLNVDLKIAAFRLVSKQKCLQFMKMVSDVYEFIADNKCFIPFIKDLIKNKKFKEAGQFTEMLRLQKSFDNPETLLLPLFLQDKISIIKDFLKDHPEIQRTYVIYLDNLLAPDSNSQKILDEFIINNDIPDVKMVTLHHKPIAKLLARLVKFYDLPPETCPYLLMKRGQGALRFLIYKRYVDGSLSSESWREMVKEAVDNDSHLQIELIVSLVNANDNMEALYFAQTYNISKKEWPWVLKRYFNGIQNSANRGNERDLINNDTWNDNKSNNFYTLNLPLKCIHIIDNCKSFKDFLDHALKNTNIVGIDSEWKPSFGVKKSELALIQIATITNVYIFDVKTLGNNVQDLWALLNMLLFNNKNILKLGFAITQDINVIRASLSALSNIRTCGEDYLDLSHLWKQLLKEERFVFPYKGDEYFTNENLSKLVELCLGLKLNKSDQFSNWERRPLRESQIKYAALDAYCLLEIYKALQIQCDILGINFDNVINHLYDPAAKLSIDLEGHNFFGTRTKNSHINLNKVHGSSY